MVQKHKQLKMVQRFTLNTVGKQTPRKLHVSFAHITVTSQRILTVRTKPKFGKFVVSFA